MFRESSGNVFITSYALELYLPYDYMGKSYRGYEYYSLLGTEVRFYGVGMMRAFKDQKELDGNPLNVKCYPLAVPMLLNSAPSEIDVRDVQYSKTGPLRRCIVLTYYKDDKFLTSMECIKSPNNVMIVLNQMEGGKFAFLSPDNMVQLLQDAQSYNGVKLRVPTEEEEIFVAERYRDPANRGKKARFSDNPDPDNLVSYSLRADAQLSTTYQAWTNEDINTSLIVSANRHDAGIIDEPTTMERVVRGFDMSGLSKERDERIEKQRKHMESMNSSSGKK